MTSIHTTAELLSEIRDVQKLLDRLEAAEKERDALRAEIDALKQQDPVAQFNWHKGKLEWLVKWDFSKHNMKPLYLAPGAQGECSTPISTLSGMFLSLDGYDSNQPGYSWRKGWNDAIRQALDYSQPAPCAQGASGDYDDSAQSVNETNAVLASHYQHIINGWLRAIDEAMVISHLGVASADDSYEVAKEKLNRLICFHTDIATNPQVNGGFKLVPVEPTETAAPEIKK